MTQEYTPTTEEIRADYSGPAGGSSAQIAYYYTRTLQFKRWLTAHDARIRAEALDLSVSEIDIVRDELPEIPGVGGVSDEFIIDAFKVLGRHRAKTER
ncbi:MAG: hypothetical protein LKI23_06805 [Bifidobacterium crudilactis]|jgi:hypothetical protein|nr:hypothetical protein [Bifidobacterium crudilactis]MCI1664638.1 hypothetical protein [Bifidobacterium crudilactis]